MAGALAAFPAFADGVSSAPKMADPAQLAGSQLAETARQAVGVPLNEAEALLKQGRAADAMAKVREAELVKDMNVYERYSTNRTKAAVALALGQTAVAFDATEAAIESTRLNGTEKLDLIASLIHASYSAKDYARAVRWADRYAKDGGKNTDIAALRMQSQYLGGDFAGAVETLTATVKADDAAGRVTTERELQLLVSSQRKLKDEAGATQTVERLATRYPKPEYWGDLLSRVDRKTMSDHLFLDFFRLLRATGNLASGEQSMVLADIALQMNFAGEALAVLDDANTKGLIKGNDLKKFQPLRAQAAKLAADDAANRKRDEATARTAKDGNALAFLGQNAVGEGRLVEGIAMIEQGLAKGGVRRPDEVRLRLGSAQALAGNKQAALKTLAAVKGPQGMTEMAHMWWLFASITPVETTATAAASK